MGECDAIGAGLKKFNLRADFAVNRIQSDVTHGATGNRAFREDGGPSAKRKALQHADEVDTVDGK